MRKVILIGTLILVSMAAAQAGENRSLSLANSDITAAAAPRPMADVRQTAEIVQLPPPVAQPAPAPAPAAVAPAPVQTASIAPAASAAAPAADISEPRAGRNSRRSTRASQPRHKRWTEARIIGELHRHGIYW